MNMPTTKQKIFLDSKRHYLILPDFHKRDE